MKKFFTLIFAVASMASCTNTEQTKQDLKQISSNIIESTAISAAEAALSEAQAKLDELKATPVAPDATFFENLSRSLAIGTAQGFVNMAQERLAKLKAARLAPVSKNPVVITG